MQHYERLLKGTYQRLRDKGLKPGLETRRAHIEGNFSPGPGHGVMASQEKFVPTFIFTSFDLVQCNNCIGKIQLEKQTNKIEYTSKENNTPLTDVDLLSNEMITSKLSEISEGLEVKVNLFALFNFSSLISRVISLCLFSEFTLFLFVS